MRSKEWLILTDNIRHRIFTHCDENNIHIDCRFAWFGDTNRFITNPSSDSFKLDTTIYEAQNPADVESFIIEYIDILWQHCEPPYNKMALYLEDIIKKDGWYEIVMGGAIFEEGAMK